MSNEKPLPREAFNCIVSRCMTVLEKHGFTPQPAPRTDPRFGEIFEDICFGWLGDVAPKADEPSPPKRETGLSQKQMDQMTLECALIFIQEGVKEVHYDESLNHIRGSITDVLEAMGYENLDRLCKASRPGWGCYKLWEAVARQDGLDEQKVAASRKWYQEKRPKHYEAA